jgi:hypothetical protein
LAARPNTFVFVLRRSRSSVPLGGHVSCSSFDDHVMLAFTVPADRVCLSTSALASALRLQRRPFLRTSLATAFTRSRFVRSLRNELGALTFSCSCPCSSFDAHGRPHSIGSQSTGSRDRVTFRRPKAPILFLFEDRRSVPHPSIALVLALRQTRSRCRTDFFKAQHILRHAVLDETQSRLRVVFANSGRRCPRISRPKLAPLPRHPDRPASLDAHDPKALPCSRSRNVTNQLFCRDCSRPLP